MTYLFATFLCTYIRDCSECTDPSAHIVCYEGAFILHLACTDELCEYVQSLKVQELYSNLQEICKDSIAHLAGTWNLQDLACCARILQLLEPTI